MERTPPKETAPVLSHSDPKQGTKRNRRHRGGPRTPFHQARITPKAPPGPRKCSPPMLDTIYVAHRPRAASYITNSTIANRINRALAAPSVVAAAPFGDSGPVTAIATARDASVAPTSVWRKQSDESPRQGIGKPTPMLGTRPTNDNIDTVLPTGAAVGNRSRTPDYTWVTQLLATPAYTTGLEGEMQTGNNAGRSSMGRGQENHHPVSFKEMISMRIGREMSLEDILEREGPDAKHESIRILPDQILQHVDGQHLCRPTGNPDRDGVQTVRRGRIAHRNKKDGPVTRSKRRKRQREEATKVPKRA